VTPAPEPLPPEPPSDPWALPSTPPTAPIPVAPLAYQPGPAHPGPAHQPGAAYQSGPAYQPGAAYQPEQSSAGPQQPGLQNPGPPYPGSPQSASPFPASPFSGSPSDSYQLAAQPGPVIVQIGELAVTSTMVRTPAGDIPLAGSTWHVTDYWHNEQKIPKWAIVMTVVGFCVLTVFSLLFLLAKETVYRGTVQVTVTNGAHQYVARVPVTDQAQVAHLHQQVNYVRSLAAL
jgi:hypothetical protein